MVATNDMKVRNVSQKWVFDQRPTNLNWATQPNPEIHAIFKPFTINFKVYSSSNFASKSITNTHTNSNLTEHNLYITVYIVCIPRMRIQLTRFATMNILWERVIAKPEAFDIIEQSLVLVLCFCLNINKSNKLYKVRASVPHKS